MSKPLEALGTDFGGVAPELGWFQLSPQVDRFPSTRFMGSKEQLLPPLWRAIGQFAPQTVLDLCSGSGVVSYMLKTQGCRVIANDYMAMATTIAKAVVANSYQVLTRTDIDSVLGGKPEDDFIEKTYGELYFDLDDVRFLDSARSAIKKLEGPKFHLAMAALIRACIKRRPRGIFTYTGRRYDDGRKDLRISLRDHFSKAAVELSNSVFDNGRECEVTNVDLSYDLPPVQADVVYVDPPYFSPFSDNEYVRRYHFPEALARDWCGVEIQHETKTKKIRNYPSPFRSEIGCLKAIGTIIDQYRDSVVVVSYSSNSLPTAADMLAHIRRHNRKASIHEVDHRYSFANQGRAKQPVRNKVKELIFVAE